MFDAAFDLPRSRLRFETARRSRRRIESAHRGSSSRATIKAFSTARTPARAGARLRDSFSSMCLRCRYLVAGV